MTLQGEQMDYRDKTLTCAECGKPFVFTAGEQRFYAEKRFEHEPKRCKECKAGRGPRPESARRDRVQTTAVCAGCGKETTVPFRPTQGRPVFCAPCFQAKKNGAAAGIGG